MRQRLRFLCGRDEPVPRDHGTGGLGFKQGFAQLGQQPQFLIDDARVDLQRFGRPPLGSPEKPTDQTVEHAYGIVGESGDRFQHRHHENGPAPRGCQCLEVLRRKVPSRTKARNRSAWTPSASAGLIERDRRCAKSYAAGGGQGHRQQPLGHLALIGLGEGPEPINGIEGFKLIVAGLGPDRILGQDVRRKVELVGDEDQNFSRHHLTGPKQAPWKAQGAKLDGEPELVVRTPAPEDDSQVGGAQV
ncbi:hypothetical protein FBZ89_12015 [Nitrospirillum amazonense]|uniref:Uncharacterized protein n=1 Tax=Nitrospirillum amazonense TaxID=28077 RepID=A0A560EWN6_9PROT|nr:hypothetical protein FBZ89_12015 [Nitrospirillum amazonense]